jgi:hypothetical protein
MWKLTDCMFVGAHDAGMSGELTKKNLGKFVSQNLSRTQNLTLSDMLSAGSTVYDVRVDREMGQAKFVHQKLQQGARGGEVLPSLYGLLIRLRNMQRNEVSCCPLVIITKSSAGAIEAIFRDVNIRDMCSKLSKLPQYGDEGHFNAFELGSQELKDNFCGLVFCMDKKCIEKLPKGINLGMFNIAQIIKWNPNDADPPRLEMPKNGVKWRLRLAGKYSNSYKRSSIISGQLGHMQTIHNFYNRNTRNSQQWREHALIQLYWTATGGNVSEHTNQLYRRDQNSPNKDALRHLLRLCRGQMNGHARPHIVMVDFVDQAKIGEIINCMDQERIHSIADLQ